MTVPTAVFLSVIGSPSWQSLPVINPSQSIFGNTCSESAVPVRLILATCLWRTRPAVISISCITSDDTAIVDERGRDGCHLTFHER